MGQGDIVPAAHPAHGVSLGRHPAGKLPFGQAQGIQEGLPGHYVTAAVGYPVIDLFGVGAQVFPESADVVDSPAAFRDGGRFRFRFRDGDFGGALGELRRGVRLDDLGRRYGSRQRRRRGVPNGKLAEGDNNLVGIAFDCQSNLNHSSTSQGISCAVSIAYYCP